MLQECGCYIAVFGTVEGKFADAYDYVVDIHTAVNTLQVSVQDACRFGDLVAVVGRCGKGGS